MIYILLLYQLYSLIHFSEKIEYELSADAKDYLRAPEAYNLKLKEIQAEINTFFIKERTYFCQSDADAKRFLSVCQEKSAFEGRNTESDSRC